MGIYRTPYETFRHVELSSLARGPAGRRHRDSFARLETREQAQKYLHDNTALADHEIETEVDRYISWPGQALSYYLGELAIWKAGATKRKQRSA